MAEKLADLAIRGNVGTGKPEQPEKPKPIIEKIPQKILDSMNKLKADKNQMLNRMLNVSFQVVELQKQQREISEKIKNNAMAFRDRIKDSARKLKLAKRKNYNWQFNGRDTFIGSLIPPQPKKEEKK